HMSWPSRGGARTQALLQLLLQGGRSINHRNPIATFVWLIQIRVSRGHVPMTHVIAEPCIGTKDTSCVEVCPVDCIHPTKEEAEFESSEMLYIDPDTCIDCGLCVDECPVQAIYPEEDLPEEWHKYIQINAEWYRQQ